MTWCVQGLLYPWPDVSKAHFVHDQSAQGSLCPWSDVSKAHYVHDLMCPRPTLSMTWHVQGQLCPWPDVSKAHYIPDLMCPRPTLSMTWRVQGQLCPWPDVSKAHYVHAPLHSVLGLDFSVQLSSKMTSLPSGSPMEYAKSVPTICLPWSLFVYTNQSSAFLA